MINTSAPTSTRRPSVPPPSSRAGLGRSTGAVTLLVSPADMQGFIHLVNFRWLNALRWAAVIGQTLAIAFVHFWMDVPLPLVPLTLIIGAELVVNWTAMYRGRTRQNMTEFETVTFVALDLAAFTALLFFTGGPSNPFSFFYIVHVSMAALILSPPLSWSLVVFSVASYAALFSWHVPLQHAAGSWDVHLHGVWVAYGLGATCVVHFIQRARAEIQEREQRIAEEANLRLQAERLSSLATLAAGAAHELASPLATIAVLSKELQHDLRDTGNDAALQDVELVRTQVERCRKILTQMAHKAGEAPGEYETWVTLDELVDEVVGALPEKERIRIVIEEHLRTASLKCPKEALSQTLRVLLDNALDASSDAVELKLDAHHGLTLSVTDSGSGMAPSVLQRVFEPFFTTKAPGKGMGLGLHLARNVVTGLGGSLTLDSHPGSGTTARIDLPPERFRLEADDDPGLV